MFKKLLSALTVMLFVFGMNAGAQELQKANLGNITPRYASKNVMTSHIEPQGTEVWTGYWDGVINDNTSAVGVQVIPMDYGIAICYPAGSEEVKGKTIEGIKFGFVDAKNITNVKVFIGTTLPQLNGAADICTDDVAEIVDIQKKGDYLNEVRFSKPYKVNPSKPVYIGYIFTVAGGSGEAEKFPVIIQSGAEKSNALLLNFGNQGWGDYYGKGFGLAAIQALVSGGNYEKIDAAITVDDAIIAEKQSFDIPVTIANFGTDGIKDFELEIDVNGIKTTYSGKPASALNNIGKEYKFIVKTNTPNESGKFAYTVKVTKINGEPVTKDIVAKGSMIIVSRQVQHKVLVEEYTGMWCQWCPKGMVALEKMAQVYGDKVTRIAIHASDALASKDFNSYVSTIQSFPGVTVDRTFREIDPYYGDTKLDFGISKAIDKCMDVTPVAEVFSKPVYNTADGILTANAEVKFLFSGNASNYALSFVVTEDGMSNDSWVQKNGFPQFKGQGLETIEPLFEPWVNGSGAMTGVIFNEVAMAGKGFGAGMIGSIPETVEEDAAVKYSTTFNLNSYKKIQNFENLNVAVILIDRSTGKIINTAISRVELDKSGIEDVTANGNAVEVARYTVDGRRINAAEKGINIVKYSDGTIKKVIVK